MLLMSSALSFADYSNCDYVNVQGDMIVVESPSLKICMNDVVCPNYKGTAVCTAEGDKCPSATDCLNQPGIYSKTVDLPESTPVVQPASPSPVMR
jgi:hypothetical protein